MSKLGVSSLYLFNNLFWGFVVIELLRTLQMGVMDMLEKGFDKIKLVAEDITRRKWLIWKLKDTVVFVKNI